MPKEPDFPDKNKRLEALKNKEEAEHLKTSENIVQNNEPLITDNSSDENFLLDDEKSMIQGLAETVPEADDNPILDRVINRERDIAPVFTGSLGPVEEPVINNPTLTETTTVNNSSASTETNKTKNQEQLKKDQEYASNTMGEANPGSSPVNAAVTMMSEKDKKEQLELTTETALWGYAKGKMLIAKFLCTNDAQLMKMEKSKGVPLDWVILYDEPSHEYLTFRQFVNTCNNAILKACETSQEFQDRIRPLVRAELEKRGWIASKQQNLGVMVLMDLFETGEKVVMINMQIAEMIKKVQNESKSLHGDAERQRLNFKKYAPPIDNYSETEPTFSQADLDAILQHRNNVYSQQQAAPKVKQEPTHPQPSVQEKTFDANNNEPQFEIPLEEDDDTTK